MKHNYLVHSLLFVIVVIFGSCSQANKITPEKFGLSGDTLQLAASNLKLYTDSGKLAGISALVYKNGEVVFREHFGYSEISKNKPIGDSTIFRIYSMTKPVTAVALMTLFDEGKFLLDDKVSKYIPEFKGAMVYNAETKTLEPQVNELTIRQLLTHTSGIPYGWDRNAHVDSLYRATGAGGWDGTIGEKVKIMAKLPLKNQPGTKWEYGLSIDVAGYLVEVLSGMPLDIYMKERIFDPLKMFDTGFFVPVEKLGRFSELYFLRNDTLMQAEGGMKDAFKSPVTLFSGGGGLVSTVNDYLSFCKMLINGGELDGVRILNEATTQLVMTNQLPEGVTYSNGKWHGLAGDVNPETGVYGWAGAASTKFWIDPENEMITIICTQLMPSDYKYADEFYKTVYSALLK